MVTRLEFNANSENLHVTYAINVNNHKEDTIRSCRFDCDEMEEKSNFYCKRSTKIGHKWQQIQRLL